MNGSHEILNFYVDGLPFALFINIYHSNSRSHFTFYIAFNFWFEQLKANFIQMLLFTGLLFACLRICAIVYVCVRLYVRVDARGPPRNGRGEFPSLAPPISLYFDHFATAFPFYLWICFFLSVFFYYYCISRLFMTPQQMQKFYKVYG